MTLIELVVSIAIIAVLSGAMGSAILLSSRAMDLSGSTARRTQERQDAALVLGDIGRDLALATSITRVSATSIGFTVPDRGHGAAGPETFLYEWSGVAGAPLTLSYNGAAATTVLANVQAFGAIATTGAGTLKSAPDVLVMVSNAGSPSAADIARRDLVTSFGFTPTLFGGFLASTGSFRTAAANCDVVYLGENFGSLAFIGFDWNLGLGIVNELNGAYSSIGFGSGTNAVSDSKIQITDIGHPITSSLLMGNSKVQRNGSTQERLMTNSGALAPGAAGLAQVSGSNCLIVVDLGGTLQSGARAKARRVNLPWGGASTDPTDMTTLSGDMQTILKRSLAWAAAPIVYQRVDLTLQAGPAPAQTVGVGLLNQPRVPR